MKPSSFKYKTRQREAILNFMMQNPEPITSMQLAMLLQSKDVHASLTTCYRHLETLFHEGVLEKYFLPNEKSAYYRYVAEVPDADVHLHLKCYKCNKLDHMACDQTLDVLQHIFKEHGFKVDSEMTYIYGVCKFCQGK